ncbi:MAG: hypothetical protein J0H82_05915 [Alphaproteobacteria bacterium]|jgi:hypothetical protein|nr:hypothetical protein [Alphaproteobacteria bacterium]
MPERPPPQGKRDLVDEVWRDLAILLLAIIGMMVIGAVGGAVMRACS